MENELWKSGLSSTYCGPLSKIELRLGFSGSATTASGKEAAEAAIKMLYNNKYTRHFNQRDAEKVTTELNEAAAGWHYLKHHTPTDVESYKLKAVIVGHINHYVTYIQTGPKNSNNDQWRKMDDLQNETPTMTYEQMRNEARTRYNLLLYERVEGS